MSYVYCLIARSRNIILTEFTDYIGNFPQKCLNILKDIKQNSKNSFKDGEYINN